MKKQHHTYDDLGEAAKLHSANIKKPRKIKIQSPNIKLTFDQVETVTSGKQPNTGIVLLRRNNFIKKSKKEFATEK